MLTERSNCTLLFAAVLGLIPSAVLAEPPVKSDNAVDANDWQELALEADHALIDLVREGTLRVELSKTQLNRRDATRLQFEAVKKAYAADTITIDQLLESQRRFAEAQMSYARTVSDMATDPLERKRVLALASLATKKRAVNEAWEIWKQAYKAHETSGEKAAAAEAQAREQYFQFESQRRSALEEFSKVKDAENSDNK
jgi:hypothetical protein